MVMLLLREAVLRAQHEAVLREAVLPRRALSEIILRKCWQPILDSGGTDTTISS